MPGAHKALYTVLQSHLSGESVWESRCYGLGLAPPDIEQEDGVTKPYLLYFFVSGGRDLVAVARDSARIVMTIKVVARDMETAMTGQEAISQLLHDAGSDDWNPRLPANSGWGILTVTEDRAILLDDTFSGAERIYHAGHQYEFVMERK